MDANPDILAEAVRAKRATVDRDLELLRTRLARVDPRRVDGRRVATRVLPAVAGVAAVWMWKSRRQRVRSLEQLLVYGLSDLRQAERQSLPALDRFRAQATNPDLQRALANHRAETEVHVERLERVFRSVDARPMRTSSGAVAALVADSERLLTRKVDHDVRDAWLIATAQRLEHLEIANYGTVRSYAETLGFTYAAQLLQETLEEERAADEKLTRLAESFVNRQSLSMASSR